MCAASSPFEALPPFLLRGVLDALLLLDGLHACTVSLGRCRLVSRTWMQSVDSNLLSLNAMRPGPGWLNEGPKAIARSDVPAERDRAIGEVVSILRRTSGLAALRLSLGELPQRLAAAARRPPTPVPCRTLAADWQSLRCRARRHGDCPGGRP